MKVEDHGYLGPVYAESDEGHAALDGGLGPEDDYADVEAHEIKKRPSIFMPRSMSRITLEVTDVRVERLQDISEANAISEGCAKNPNGHYWGGPHPESGTKQLATAVGAYHDLWESINGPGSVSYTHLDVYKRQHSPGAESRRQQTPRCRPSLASSTRQ